MLLARGCAWSSQGLEDFKYSLTESWGLSLFSPGSQMGQLRLERQCTCLRIPQHTRSEFELRSTWEYAVAGVPCQASPPGCVVPAWVSVSTAKAERGL